MFFSIISQKLMKHWCLVVMTRANRVKKQQNHCANDFHIKMCGSMCFHYLQLMREYIQKKMNGNKSFIYSSQLSPVTAGCSPTDNVHLAIWLYFFFFFVFRIYFYFIRFSLRLMIFISSLLLVVFFFFFCSTASFFVLRYIYFFTLFLNPLTLSLSLTICLKAVTVARFMINSFRFNIYIYMLMPSTELCHHSFTFVSYF